ncbi:MAG TPA: lactate utilization protein B [Syntrophomonadaceae bacterium]|nr:lactate utilization protein B [Syntrophomonadaceae bacterium]
MKANPRMFKKIAKEEAANQAQIDFMGMVSGVFNYLCDTAMGVYGDDMAQEAARTTGGQIRHNTLSNLAELLEKFEEKATANGMKVLWAKDADEACQTVVELVKKYDAKVITKGKSMITEEIDLNSYIEEKTDAKIYEGDLGEFIVQLRGTAPFHIVGPAINLKLNEMVDILHDNIDMPQTEDANEIANYVRGFLRTQFQQADMGITGVNQAIASTGSLLLVENEGNIRWSTSAPKVHVALMSIEKVCDNLVDAFYLAGLLTRNCTGQSITSYVSLINQPRLEGEHDGPEEIYVIILDNGRSKAYLDEELRETLRCIRCGRCCIKCPIYLTVGAYPYSNSYPGPMGVVLMPLLIGVDETEDLFEACTLCGACAEICPAQVPHLTLYARYRQMKAQGDREFKATSSITNRLLFKSFVRGISKRKFYERGLSVARTFSKRSVKDGYITRLPGPASSWFTCRDLPEIPATTFKDYWESEGYKLAKEGEKDE